MPDPSNASPPDCYAIAQLILDTLSALATVAAVIVALFRDEILERINPIKLAFNVKETGGQPTRHPNGTVCWYHGIIWNKTRGRPVRSCSVDLVAYIAPDESGVQIKHVLATPRQFQWTPAVTSAPTSTFARERQFDIGRLTPDGFVPGVFNEHLDGAPVISAPGTYVWEIEVRAENLVSQTRFQIEITWLGGCSFTDEAKRRQQFRIREINPV